MRLLASLPDQDQATRFGDYLLTIGIDNSVEEGASGWQVWVKDDDKLEAAKRELEHLLTHPEDPRYLAAGRDAQQIRSQEARRAERRAKNYVDVRTQWSGMASGAAIITYVLIGVCCFVYVVMLMGKDRVSFVGLLLAPEMRPAIRKVGPLSMSYYPPSRLEEVGRGQVWRLITPIFIHFGPLHLLFDMWMLRSFGTIIEQRKGHLRLALMVLIIAIPSNLVQYIMSGPAFGGMSGVVYGLFGYIWMKGKYSPHEGMQLHPHTIFFMIAWFVLCFTGWVGPIANTAHAAGLLAGMLFGIAPHWRRRFFR